jgi:hypothetical protein
MVEARRLGAPFNPAALLVVRRLVGCAGQITCAGSRETWSASL